jgi:hypothetical protein
MALLSNVRVGLFCFFSNKLEKRVRGFKGSRVQVVFPLGISIWDSTIIEV